MRSRREAFVGSSRCGSSALPASAGAEAAVLFLLDFISAKNSVHLGRQRGGGENPARSVCLAGNHLLILRWGGWRAVQRLPRALQCGEAGALCRVLHFGLQLGSAENTACGGRDGRNGARRRSSATAPAADGAEGKGQGRSWCQGLAVSRGLSTSTGERVWSSLSSMCW